MEMPSDHRGISGSKARCGSARCTGPGRRRCPRIPPAPSRHRAQSSEVWGRERAIQIQRGRPPLAAVRSWDDPPSKPIPVTGQ